MQNGVRTHINDLSTAWAKKPGENIMGEECSGKGGQGTRRGDGEEGERSFLFFGQEGTNSKGKEKGRQVSRETVG